MKFIKTLVAVAAVAAAFSAQAESNIVTAATGTLTANAKLDYRITVPRILFLRVGTSAGFVDASGGLNLDRVDFILTPADVSSAVPKAGVSGQGAYGVTARVLGNGGVVNFSAAGSGTGLTGVGLPVVPWTQIAPVATGGTLVHPVINALAIALPAVGGVVNQNTVYTFNYTNTATLPAGTYNGQVTYTAVMP